MQTFWYILLVGVVLALDAIAVSITDGIVECKMKQRKVLLIALFFAVFQFAMPVIGYFASSLLEDFIAKFAHWISFILLLIVGGKMIVESVKEMREKDENPKCDLDAKLTVGELTVQAIATSIDALAVGITMLACEATGNLYANVWIDGAIIGVVTFILCVIAVNLGKYAGSKIKVPSAAQLVGGAVLVLIGVKILLEGLGVLNMGF